MADFEKIGGEHYSAEFFPGDSEDQWSSAYAVVKPPFSLERAGMLVETQTISVEVGDYATTESATVLHLQIEQADTSESGGSQSRMNLLYSTLVNIIGKLNEIESGIFPGNYK